MDEVVENVQAPEIKPEPKKIIIPEMTPEQERAFFEKKGYTKSYGDFLVPDWIVDEVSKNSIESKRKEIELNAKKQLQKHLQQVAGLKDDERLEDRLQYITKLEQQLKELETKGSIDSSNLDGKMREQILNATEPLKVKLEKISREKEDLERNFTDTERRYRETLRISNAQRAFSEEGADPEFVEFLATKYGNDLYNDNDDPFKILVKDIENSKDGFVPRRNRDTGLPMSMNDWAKEILALHPKWVRSNRKGGVGESIDPHGGAKGKTNPLDSRTRVVEEVKNSKPLYNFYGQN